MLTSKFVRGERFVVRQAARALSTPPGAKVPMTPEEKERAIKHVENFKKFNRASPYPTFIPPGTGSDLHVPKNIGELAALSNMPAEHARRTVLIRPRENSVVQSNFSRHHQWQIVWKPKEKWGNPLMGWTSSADTMSQVKLYFNSKEEAIAFADRNNWKYETSNDITKEPPTQSYKDNFLDKRTQKTLKKDGAKCQVFANPAYGQSHWFMPLQYHGVGEVRQHGPSVKA